MYYFYPPKKWRGSLVLFSVTMTFCNIFYLSIASEVEVLVNFKNSLSNNYKLYNWNLSGPSPCRGDTPNWVGLRCNSDGTVDKILLENMGLYGTIDLDQLARLTSLRTLSLLYNNFKGPLPQINKLGSLRNLYLSHNNFSGDISDAAFDGMNSLKELYLANNNFCGEIPKSLLTLKRLQKLGVEGNQFEGNIPDFQQNFLVFNVADNNLTGRIPASLFHLDPSFFAGNKDLCGKPLKACKSSSKRFRILIIIIIVVVILLVLATILTIASIRSRKNKIAQSNESNAIQKETRKAQKAQNMNLKAQQSPQDQYSGLCVKKRGEVGQLHFVRDGRENFDMQDLLKASAEVLGSGNFGSSYKAVLLNGPSMVVKRFKHMNNVGREEFCEHMRRLGKLSHPNLLPLVAFYYRKEEKLLISDFVDNGSLASHLHTKLAPGQPGLDWSMRLKIIKGVAQGLSYLYAEFTSLTLPHGHLKSSNVLLNQSYEPLLTDYALVPVVNKDLAQQVMVAYKSPEFARENRTDKKTDVWSLGILILEILTGKFPTNYLRRGKSSDSDLVTWVNSVVREEWTGEVFDKEMRGTRSGEGEMLKLLKIGLSCCESDVEKRFGLREAVGKIEELKERDIHSSDNEGSSTSHASEGEVYSSRAMSEEDFSFSVIKDD